jgi:putative SOS response-associated peptidase YedK
MCGRFTRSQSWAEVVAFSRLPVAIVAPELPPSWNVAPSQSVAMLVHEPDRGFQGVAAHWGLRPAWATQARTAPINARADGVASKPFFRAAFRRRRCLVAADGWYEWQALADGKQPHYILRRDGDPLFFAGIWEPAAAEGALPSVAIVTTEAAAELRALHERQPVVLAEGDWEDWLTLPGEARTALEDMLHPLPEGTFHHFPVSRAVNAPRNDGASLIAPAPAPAGSIAPPPA